MISQKTIDAVYDLPIVEVIEKFVSLKRSGPAYKGHCPFHNEKTPSFQVSPVKNIYKCFGCGKGGNNAINFIMSYKNIEWLEAVKELCQAHNIFIEYEDNEETHKYIEYKKHRDHLLSLNGFALDVYKSQRDLLLKYLEGSGRSFTKEQEHLIELFDLGAAPDEWQFLHSQALKKGLRSDDLMKLGIISESSGRKYDSFRGRIIFPIYNYKKELTGFTGRVAVDAPEGAAKYKNSKDSELFNKSRELYGIHLAKNDIAESNCAHIVEGNWDFISMYMGGVCNTVAPCGTALTIGHLELLKKFCKHLIFVYDGDKAGKAAIEKNTPLALKEGFTVEIVLLPDGKDPDSFCREGNDIEEFIDKNKQDAVFYISDIFFQNADTTVKRTQSQSLVETLLSNIANEKLRGNYCRDLAKKFKLSLKTFERNVHQLFEGKQEEEEPDYEVPLPEGVSREEYERHGFVEWINGSKTGYYFWKPGSGDGDRRKNFIDMFSQQSNFIIKPLFHVYSKSDNKRLIEIDNGKYKRILDLPSKAFVGIQNFREIMYSEGNFRFDGSATHLNKIVGKISDKFPLCYEIKTLGWQDEGFWAYANGSFTSDFNQVNDYGITEYNKQFYFSPAFSKVYSEVRAEDDFYENDRFFIYKKSPINFEKWSDTMLQVYGDNGKVAIAFFVAALFRDIIYNRFKIFPHLFLFGEKGSGKSQLGWSLSNVFWNGQPGFNLTSGTNVGFYRKLARARNAITWFDEYNNTIDPKRFQALKSAYDGLGHEKGVMSRDNRTESTKVNSACVISGQYLPTLDDNALFTRSIMLTFTKAHYENNEGIKTAYKELKEYEEKGLSSVITEIIKYREEMEKSYSRIFYEEFSRMRSDLGDGCEERIIRNLMTIISAMKTIQDQLKLPFDYEKLYGLAKTMIIDQSGQIQESETISVFWNVVSFLFERGEIKKEIDFKIELKRKWDSLTIMRGRDITEPLVLEKDTKVLFIRMNSIHPLYMETHRRQYATNGIDLQSLRNYFRHNKAFIGTIQSYRFGESGDINTSCYAFDYEKMKLNLERESGSFSNEQAPVITSHHEKVEKEDNLPF